MAGNNKTGALYPGGGRDVTIGDVQMTANAWHHLALVRSGNTMSFYLDGVRTGYDGNALFNGWTLPILDISTSLRILGQMAVSMAELAMFDS